MNNLIEKLKDKDYVRAFGLMSEEEQECYQKVGKQNCLVYCISGNWTDKMPCQHTFWKHEIHAIKPDYQPEPEYVDYEIDTWNNDYLSCKIKNDDWRYLYELPSLPNFEKFWVDDYENGSVFIDAVARNMATGHKVYARLRK